MKKNYFNSIFSKFIAVTIVLTIAICMFVVSQKNVKVEANDENVTKTINLFNSGRTDYEGKNSTGSLYVDAKNPSPSTYTNNGYDIYVRANTDTYDCESSSQLGLEFAITEAVVEVANVTIYAYDVDEEDGEIDGIYLVNKTKNTSVRLGALHGMNEGWNTTTFRVDPSKFEVGCTYYLKIKGENSSWCVYVRTCSIQLTTSSTGETPEPVGPKIEEHSFTASIDANGYVSTSLYLKTNQAVQYKLEYAASINGNQKGQNNQTITANESGVTTTGSFKLESGSPVGTYKVDVIVKDINNNVITSFTTTAGYQYSSVSYDSNGGSTNIPLDVIAYSSGNTVTILFDYIPSKKGYKFLGWSLDPNATTPEFTENGNKSFVIGTEDVKLYAVWEKLPTSSVPSDSWDGTIATGFAGGNGTQSNPYLINTAEQLAYLAKQVNSGNTFSGKYVRLESHLDLAGYNWTPIGTASYPFYGNFDGGYCVIYNLTVNQGYQDSGLFGYIKNSKISCVALENVNANYNMSSTYAAFGGVVGFAYNSYVSNCYVKGIIYNKTTSSSAVLIGGVVGRLYEGGSITNCYSNVNITATCSGYNSYIGGIVGTVEISSATVSNCYSICNINNTVTSYNYATSGGIVGDVWATTTVKNCFAVATLYSKGNGSYTDAVVSNAHGSSCSSSNNYYANSSTTSRYGSSTELNNFKTQSWISANLGWDFGSTWEMGSEYPVLKGFVNNVKCNHKYEEIERVEATCTENGYVKSQCSLCENIKEEVLEATGHTESDWIIDSEPTCTVNGSKHTNCTVCGEVVNTQTIPATGHTDSEWIIDSEPTCTVNGSKHTNCTVCGEVVNTQTIPATGHTDSEWIIDSEPTCTTPGSKHTICTVCGEVSHTSFIPKLVHEYESVVTVEVTCTTPGIITYTCVHCNASYQTYIYSEHSYELSEHIEPTCTIDGKYIYTCTKCNDSYEEIIPGSHDYVAEIVKLASPTEDGLIVHTCSRCGDHYDQIIPMRPDAKVLLVEDRRPWNEDTNSIILNRLQADGYLTGWDKTTSSNFGSINIADYSLIFIANDQSTSTYNTLAKYNAALENFAQAGGVVIYGACDHGWAAGDISYALPGGVTIGNYYSYRNYIANDVHPIVTGELTDGRKLTNELLYSTYSSHTYFNKESLPEGATVILEDAMGKATLVDYAFGNGRIILSGLTWEYTFVRNFINGTSFAKTIYDDLIAYALQNAETCDHAYGEGVLVAPTCTEQGYTSHKCAKCGSELRKDYVEPTGHTASDWEVVVEPTLTETGLQQKVCTNCSVVLDTEVLPKLNAAVVTVSSNTDSVPFAQTIEFTITIEKLLPATSLQLIPVFDTNVFEFVSAEWLIDGENQSIDLNSRFASSSWTEGADLNTVVFKFVLKAIHVADSTKVSCQAIAVVEGETIDLAIKATNVQVSSCEHINHTYENIDAVYHAAKCTDCGHVTIEEHVLEDGNTGHCINCSYYKPIQGDLDNDKDVDMDDATYLLMYTFFSADYPLNQDADFDGDGQITKDDAIYLLKYTYFPEEYPLKGEY